MNSVTRDYFRTGFKRWLRWIALAVVFAIACGFLANWQWNRRTQVVNVIARLDHNYDFRVLPLEALVPNRSGFSSTKEYRPVMLAGHYLLQHQTLLRNQPNNGNPGFHQLIPFQLNGGGIVIVDRGWLPTGDRQDSPDLNPLPPASVARLVGRLHHAQQPDSRVAPKGQAMSIYPAQLAKDWGIKPSEIYAGAYVMLADDGTAGSLPIKATKPDITEGNHLSYTFQWILFGLMAFAAIFVNIRRDIQEKRVAEDAAYVPKPKRKRMGDDDKEAEDALLGN